ncbi:MAG TPA: hypothetical protein PL108_02850, partial [Sediminibacterium sp.]|nr:hypothetical protein [Sediminibacterium sp.]
MKTNSKNRLLSIATMLLLLISAILGNTTIVLAQVSKPNTAVYYITANKVFDGENMQPNWAVIVQGNTIQAAGPKEKF